MFIKMPFCFDLPWVINGYFPLDSLQMKPNASNVKLLLKEVSCLCFIHGKITSEVEFLVPLLASFTSEL